MYTAVIILNYNNWEDTINCIESVEEYNSARIKYIVVDNGSTRVRCIDALESFFIKRFSGKYKKIYDTEVNESPLPYLTFLVSQHNDGYARGNNKGLHLVYADKNVDYIMILNNDILFVQDIIPSLLSAVKELQDCAIVSPILYKKGMTEIDYNCARKSKDTWDLILSCFDIFNLNQKKYLVLKSMATEEMLNPIEVELPSGSCMFLNRSLMQSIGGFDPNTFLYFEEDILYKKLSKIGFRNYVIPTLKCIHLGASSTNKTGSVFLVKTAFESMKYYLQIYCSLNVAQRSLLVFATLYTWIKLKLLRIKTNIHF